MRDGERVGLVLAALLLAAMLLLWSRCEAPGPTPTPGPWGTVEANQTRIEELYRWQTPSPTISATPTGTGTPSATPPAATPTSTACATPSRTPEATLTATPEAPPLTVKLQGIAKAGSYATFVFDFEAPYVASIGLEGKDGTAFYNEAGNSTPPVNCKPLSGLCWEVSGSFRGTARLYFLSTWKPGDIVQLTAWVLRQEELMRIPLDPIVIGGGTAAPTPTITCTPTRTPAPATIITVPTGKWIAIENVSRAAWLYWFSEGPEPVCECMEWAGPECIRVEDGCRGLCGTVWISTTANESRSWLRDGSGYGWHSAEVYGAQMVYLAMEGWGDAGACRFRITKLKASNVWVESANGREAL